MPLITDIKNFKLYDAFWNKEKTLKKRYHNNYPCGEHCPRTDMGEHTLQEIYPNISDKVFELFEEFCEYGEYGFHSIIEIFIQRNPKKYKLL